MNTDQKDVKVGLNNYRIIRMNPFVGSRIMSSLFAATAKSTDTGGNSEASKNESSDFDNLSAEEKGNISIQVMWLNAVNVLPTDKYEEIQKAALRCCQFYISEDAPPTPILMSSGRWAIKELNPSEVSQLIVEALQFNLGPFFPESASKAGGTIAPSI